MITPPHLFHQQMAYLKNNGYRTISPEMLFHFLKYRHQIPKKSVLITFDDGYRSVFEYAVPILKNLALQRPFLYIPIISAFQKKPFPGKRLKP